MRDTSARTLASIAIPACCLLALASCGRPAAKSAAPTTAAVTRGDIRLTVEATGSVESNLDVEIKCKASGEVEFVAYDVSDRVPEHVPGVNDDAALLVRLNPIDEQRRVERAQANHDAAKARKDQADQSLAIARENVRTAALDADAAIDAAVARDELARKQLADTKALADAGRATPDELYRAQSAAKVSAADLKTAQAIKEKIESLRLTVQLRQAELDLATAQLAAAQVDLDDAKQRLIETKVYAPISGTITACDVKLGQIVASGIVTVGGGTKLMTLSDLSRIFVIAAVDESDIGRLVETGRLGQDAAITVDAYPGRRFRGRVERITPRGRSEANVVTFDVKIEVLDADKDLLRPKMTATVEILADEKSGVLLVPLGAVYYDAQGPYAEVMADGKPAFRRIRLGISDGLQAEVLDGLAEGEQVSIVGPSTKPPAEAATREAE